MLEQTVQCRACRDNKNPRNAKSGLVTSFYKRKIENRRAEFKTFLRPSFAGVHLDNAGPRILKENWRKGAAWRRVIGQRQVLGPRTGLDRA
jgi:hypothetical protein